MISPLMYKTVAIVSSVVWLTPTAFPVDNYFLPHGIQDWHVPSNWSQGYCPLPAEHVYIQATTTTPKYVIYDWTGVSGYDSVTIDGNGSTYYGAIYQDDLWLDTDDLKMSVNGDSYYHLEGPAYLSATDHLWVGYTGTHPATFTLETVADTSAGLSVGNYFYVGYNAPGEFNHQTGFAEAPNVYVGQSDEGEYTLSGTTAGSKLTVTYHLVVGNGDVGTFTQNGGTIEQTHPAGSLTLGLNTGGIGTFNMTDGQFDLTSMSIGWNGDGYFNHTGGTVTSTGNVTIGLDGTHPMRAWYKMADTNGDPELLVGGDLRIGPSSLAKFEQNSGGTTVVDGDIEIWEGAPGDYSYLYLGLSADWMSAARIINHSGYYDQDGGDVSTPIFTNDSTYGINLDNNADLRATNVTHNTGTFHMWRNAILRGQYAGGGVYSPCNFTNNATFQMGSVSFDGGTFFGNFTNHGTFNYYQGDFSESTFTNHGGNGSVNLHEDFTCRRFVNYGNVSLPTGRWINADGTGYPNAVENNGNLTMYPDSHFDVGYGGLLVNNGPMYAGGPESDYAHIFGNMINNDYLLPSFSSGQVGFLYINGDFTANPGAELRIRIHGTTTNTKDRLAVQAHASLGGELDVRFTNGFVPNLGDTFSVIAYGTHSGVFNPVYLPALPAGWEWDIEYGEHSVDITVVEEGDPCPADLTGDNQVNIDDIFAVLGLWGDCPDPCPPYCPGDITEDCTVNIDDIFAILGQWGPCE